MKRFLKRVWCEDEGVLTFEWILLITVLVIGITGGLSAVRDAVLQELGDVAEAMVNLDQSYEIGMPFAVGCTDDGASDSGPYTDIGRYDEGYAGTNSGQAMAGCATGSGNDY